MKRKHNELSHFSIGTGCPTTLTPSSSPLMPIISSLEMNCHGCYHQSYRKIWHPHAPANSVSSSSSPPSTDINIMDCPSPNSSRRSSSCTTAIMTRTRFPLITKGHRKRRWLSLFQILTLSLFLFTLSFSCVGGSEDWSLQCPSGCKCTWISGKKTADCKSSHWTTIPSGLSPEVQVLDMSGSSMKTLPKDSFKTVGLVNVQKVFLQRCGIERIDREAFRDLEIMIELDLSYNKVTSLEMETFESNVRLRELKLGNNPLTKLTGSHFPPLMYLKLLDLTDCQLSSFPKRAFEKLSVLETLSLGGNRFTHLNEEVLRPLIKLKSLSLAGNPWKCDCRLKSLRDWVIAKNVFQRHTKCAEPAHVANFPWDQLMSGDFACRPEIESVQINGKPTDALLVHTDIGSDIRLECLVRGNPPPDLKWVRDGQVLTNTSRSYGKSYFLHIGEENEDGQNGITSNSDYPGQWVNLTILKTDPEDAGEYTCVGINPGGVAEKNLTLNFQDVPSGAGVGHGLGGLGSGSYRDTGWIVILITVLALLVIATSLITLICFCSRRRRVKTTRAQDLKGVESQDQPQQRQLLLTPTSRSDGSEKIEDEGSTLMLIKMKEKYLVGPDARSQSADILSYGEKDGLDSLYHRPSSAQPHPPPIPSSALLGPHGIHHQSNEYPDLLDLPHSRFQESPAPSTVSTLPDSTRMLITPQQLNPAMLARGFQQQQQQQSIYGTVNRRPISPYDVNMLPQFSPTEPVIVPGRNRPGYVTLPRRPRVPSWSPGPTDQSPPSPTGSAATVSFPLVKARPIYDNLGPRTTADGSSILSLNNIGNDGSTPNLKTPTSHFHHQPPFVTGTLGRHSMLRSTPTQGPPKSHFAPIAEIEPLPNPAEDEDRPGSDDVFDKAPRLPKVGPSAYTPSKTEPSSVNGTLTNKKLPPKPPPKPIKKKSSEGTQNGGVGINSSSPQKSNSAPADPVAAAIAGEDGTEV